MMTAAVSSTSATSRMMVTGRGVRNKYMAPSIKPGPGISRDVVEISRLGKLQNVNVNGGNTTPQKIEGSIWRWRGWNTVREWLEVAATPGNVVTGGHAGRLGENAEASLHHEDEMSPKEIAESATLVLAATLAVAAGASAAAPATPPAPPPASPIIIP